MKMVSLALEGVAAGRTRLARDVEAWIDRSEHLPQPVEERHAPQRGVLELAEQLERGRVSDRRAQQRDASDEDLHPLGQVVDDALSFAGGWAHAQDNVTPTEEAGSEVRK